MYSNFIRFVREIYHSNQFIPLHEPRFTGKEKEYLNDCIDSTFVSSVGAYVDRFEQEVAAFTGAGYAVAAVNGTAALHLALELAGVKAGDLVVTQPLSFIATANAIRYCNARPLFIDVDRDTLGLSPEHLQTFLDTNTYMDEHGICRKKKSNEKISACVPMHTFGHPSKVDLLKDICLRYHIALIEDAAESIGSYYQRKHTGTFGELGILSFNGNKVITTGGGGMILTDDAALAKKAKHLSTQAKVPHPWAYQHDAIGYNYRLPNINAALGCAQLEQLPEFIENKRALAAAYAEFFEGSGLQFVREPEGAKSNYWLNAVLLENRDARDQFLKITNEAGVMTRPAWRLLNSLNMYREFNSGNLENALWLEKRLVNIPSSVTI